MARRLFADTAAAAAALAVFVLWNGVVVGVYWVMCGYTAWPLVPVLAQAPFFAAIWLIHARAEAARWRDAGAVGAAIGLAFLAHVTPAVVLVGVAAAAAFAAQGFRPRTVAWLAAVAAALLVVVSPYLLPVLVHYPRGTLHSSYEWVEPWFEPTPVRMAKVAALSAPGVAAVVAVWGMRRWAPPMPRPTAAILAAWVAVPAVFLLRHYACALAAPAGGWAEAPAACRVFVTSVHHYHVYLQLAWPCLIGFAAWHLARRWGGAGGRGGGARLAPAAAAAALLLCAGGAALLARPFDARVREEILLHGEERFMDLAAYRCVLEHTRPEDVFATLHHDTTAGGPEAFTVIAAGRQLVSAPVYFSHPYVEWPPREAQRTRYLDIATGAAAGDLPCGAAGRGLWFLLPNAVAVDTGRVEAVFRTALNTVHRAKSGACAADPPGGSGGGGGPGARGRRWRRALSGAAPAEAQAGLRT